MNLRDLEYFLSVVQCKSFSIAAQKMFVTQPAVTIAIQRLEAETGVKLFDRSQKNIVLSPAGRSLYLGAERVMREVDHLKRTMNSFRQDSVNTLTIALSGVSCASVFPIIYNHFLHEYPNTHLIIKDMFSPDVYSSIEKLEVEIGFCMIPEEVSRDLRVFKLSQGQISVLVPNDHPMAQKNNISLIDLSQEEFLLFRTGGSYTENLLRQHFTRQDLNFPQPIYLRDNQTLVFMASAGCGIYPVPDSEANLFFDSLNCQIIGLAPPITFDIGLLYNKRQHISETARLFINYFKRLRKE